MEGALPDSLTHGVVTDDVAEAVELIWRERRNVTFRPRGSLVYERCEQMLRACREAGRVILLVDVSVYLFTARISPDAPVLELLRGHRHAGKEVGAGTPHGVWCLFTTHHFNGDIPQALLACNPWTYVFRTLQPVVLDRLESYYGLDRLAVQRLPQGECFVVYQGFTRG